MCGKNHTEVGTNLPSRGFNRGIFKLAKRQRKIRLKLRIMTMRRFNSFPKVIVYLKYKSSFQFDIHSLRYSLSRVKCYQMMTFAFMKEVAFENIVMSH